jgi:multidrug efflux pump
MDSLERRWGSEGRGCWFDPESAIAIVGGLVFSQMLTLFTTPVAHLWFNRLANWIDAKRGAPIYP